MKFNYYLYIAISALCLMNISCDDDLNSVGLDTKPGGDDIFLSVDTVNMEASTIAVDKIYARTFVGILGEYVSDDFGKIKSDYLCEFYCPEDQAFHKNAISVDSAKVRILLSGYAGDTLSPIGLSIYEVNKKNLEKTDIYTNHDIADFCDKTVFLGQGLFTIDEAKKATPAMSMSTLVNKSFGEKFLAQWRTNPETFTGTKEMREFFKGLYITTTVGSGTILYAPNAYFDIYYKYTGRNYNDTRDSIRTSTFRLAVTREVIQLNNVENKVPDKLLEPNKTELFLSSPAGLNVELKIPFQSIYNKAKNTNTVLNSASFKVYGYTEKEEDVVNRPDFLLMIPSDSITNFFEEGSLPNGVSTFLLYRNIVSNTYVIYGQTTTANVSELLNHYITYYKENPSKTVPEYLKYQIIPVDVKAEYDSNGMLQVAGVYNLMYPSNAILRKSEKYMKLPLVFTEYNKP